MQNSTFQQQIDLCNQLIEQKIIELDDAFQNDDGSSAYQEYINGLIRELEDALQAKRDLDAL